MVKLRKQTSISARALEFLILTATRTGETLCACFDEIDLAARIWTIPAERMKAGKDHRQPLAGLSLRRQPREEARQRHLRDAADAEIGRYPGRAIDPRPRSMLLKFTAV